MTVTQWTTEQVLALAPDAASAKNGRGLAAPRKWVSLHYQQAIVWGECQGSGKTPYRTQIDTAEPAFRCSCPSRKFPCKHGLGLFLLLVEQPTTLTEAEPADWVTEWLASRAEKQAKQAEKQAKQQEKASDPVAQAKRASERQHKITAGIQELRLWLEDRVRQGLATIQQESYSFWDAPAARMVDAQAPGLGRHLRDMAGIALAQKGRWMDDLLTRLSQLYLLIEGFERIEQLPAPMQADIRTQMGWPIAQEEVLAGPAITDLWFIASQRIEEEERLRSRRTWLQGKTSGQSALLLDFAHGNQPFDQAYLLGTWLDADLVFYPSAYPVRALVKARRETTAVIEPLQGHDTIAAAIAMYSRALAAYPWLERCPLLLNAVLPLRHETGWQVQDLEGSGLPLAPSLSDKQGWQLIALSGGHPLQLFGEWNGKSFLPLSAWAEGVFYGIGNE